MIKQIAWHSTQLALMRLKGGRERNSFCDDQCTSGRLVSNQTVKEEDERRRILSTILEASTAT